MKTNMLLVLGFNSGDAIQAEKLLDWCFELNGKQPLEHPIVLMAAPNVHPELQMKVKLAAEVAFEHVELLVVGGQIGDKTDGCNRLFKAGAHAAANNYRSEWLWLEPDCVPLRKGWLEELQAAYYEQPKRFFGPHAKFQVGQETKTCLVRVACYPQNAFADLAPYCDSIAAFNQVAAEVIVARSTKCRLIQQLEIHGPQDFDKVRPDAVLLHSDKTGELIRHYQAKAATPVAAPVEQEAPPMVVVEPEPVFPENSSDPKPVTTSAVPKIDGRSKAAREAKKAALAVT